MIQQIVDDTNCMLFQAQEQGQLTKRVLAIGVEINQRYTEYLDELLDSDLSQPQGVTVDANGCKLHFKNLDDFSSWLVEKTGE
jgi:hypothetical protein